jgi:hypothetical protein
MFTRTRLKHRRLQISLVDTRRVDGKVRQQHIAALGSVPPNMTAADRLAFWDQAYERLARLGNRLGKDGRDKIINEIAARVPPLTEAERDEAESYPELRKGVAILLKAGWSTADIVRAIRLAELNDNEFEETVTETVSIFQRAERAAFNKVYKRRQRSAHA